MSYYVEVYTYHPYKIEKSYMVKGSSYETAIRRGVELFRKEDKLKGKRLQSITVNARRA